MLLARLAVRYGLVVLAGVVTAIGFPPYGLAWLLPAGVALLSLAARDQRPRRGFLLGFVFGAVFLLVLMPWLKIVGVDAWIGLSVLEALFYGLLGWGLARTSRLRWWPLWQTCLWVGVELMRGMFPFGGFNWGRLAFATVDLPVSGAVAYVGTAGVTFLVALAGGLLAWAARPPHATDGVRRAAAVAAAVAVFAVPALAPTWTGTKTEPVTIAAVQGNVPGSGLDPFDERRVVLDNHVRATEDLAAQIQAGEQQPVDIVFWPENSTDIDPYQDPVVMAEISSAVDTIGVPTLVGAMIAGPGPKDVKNKGIVWLPGLGPTTSYAKMHPVPFGEYIPMRKLLAQHIKRLDEIPRDMVAGAVPGNLTMAGVPVGDVICFEVIYDDLVHTVVRRGAELLIVQTNNATYMGTGQVDQQYAISRLRARETGRYVAVAATNGISGIIRADGSVLAQAPKKQTKVLVETVPRITGLSPAVRWGRWLELALSLLGVAAVAVSLRRT
ncbi:MAG: apolipoprotein N-acyltransferase [Nocardioidaceae bacterium]